jgi:hypothetical protein
MNKKFFIINFFTVFIIIFLSNGCKNGPTVISYGEPLISAELRTYDSIHLPRAYVKIEGTELLPIVVINYDTLELGNCSPKGQYMWESYFADEVSTDPENEYELMVSHSRGEANATITLPGNFGITSPQEEDTLHLNEDLLINWSSSEGAERYNLRIRLYCYYGDTANPTQSSFRLDTLLSKTQTSLTLQKEKIFSSEIDSVQEGFGYVDISAENGPQVGISAEGNIYGEGVGYFATSNGRAVHLVIEDTSN